MSDIFAQVSNTVQGMSIDSDIRNILIEHFDIQDDEKNAGYKAAALDAVEVSIAIANMFLATRKSEAHRTMRLLSDLVIGLNNNQFWVRNAPSIVPMIQAAIFDYFDEQALVVEKTQNNGYAVYDGLILASRNNPIAIISYILYLLGGPTLAIANSTKLKKALYPFFNR